MTVDGQESLFGGGKLTPPKQSSTPDIDAIRTRLNTLLRKLSTSETMPFSERDIRMWATIVPNMVKWLPEAEGVAITESFNNEIQRLTLSG